MSDSYFVGTIARVHKLWRFSETRSSKTKSSIDEDVLKKLLAMDDADLQRLKFLDSTDIEKIRALRNGNSNGNGAESPHAPPAEPKPEIGMMVSLDHTIYFHDPRGFRADEWMFTEMETPWADDGRGLVFQRMFTRSGRLIATCVQEGLVRLKQDGDKSRSKL
jgi:acyl-CoA thioesterase 8